MTNQIDSKEIITTLYLVGFRMNDKEKNKNALDVIEKICPNCKRINSEHSEKEFLYCTKKILKDLVLADENRRGMIHNQQNKKILEK